MEVKILNKKSLREMKWHDEIFFLETSMRQGKL